MTSTQDPGGAMAETVADAPPPGADGVANAPPPGADGTLADADGTLADADGTFAAADASPAHAFVAVFRVMDVDDVSLDLPSQYPLVTLVEAEPPHRELVFPVGLTEGTAMAQALRRLTGARPMTHELFAHVLRRAHIDVIAVRVIGREDGNLLAELDLMTPRGRERIDCRPSDAIVLALRMPVPAVVLVDERLLEDPGDVVPADPPRSVTDGPGALADEAPPGGPGGGVGTGSDQIGT